MGYKEGTSNSLNDLYYFTPGVYYTRFVSDTPDGIDSSTTSGLIVAEFFKDANQAKVLQVFTVPATGAIYTRVSEYYSNGTDIQHGTWARQYDTSLLTNSALLGPLASALGVPTNLYRLPEGADLNDYTDPGIWYLDIGVSTGIANVPPSFYYGVVVSITASNQTMQYAGDSGSFWFRRGDTGNFSPWLRCDNFGCNTLAELKAALANV